MVVVHRKCVVYTSINNKWYNKDKGSTFVTFQKR